MGPSEVVSEAASEPRPADGPEPSVGGSSQGRGAATKVGTGRSIYTFICFALVLRAMSRKTDRGSWEGPLRVTATPGASSGGSRCV
jgi:hypothetical protein